MSNAVIPVADGGAHTLFMVHIFILLNLLAWYDRVNFTRETSTMQLFIFAYNTTTLATITTRSYRTSTYDACPAQQNEHELPT